MIIKTIAFIFLTIALIPFCYLVYLLGRLTYLMHQPESHAFEDDYAPRIINEKK